MVSKKATNKKPPTSGKSSKPAKNSGANDGKPRSAVVKKQKGGTK